MADLKRKKRIEELIKRELGTVLLSHPIRDIFNKVTITAVDISPDLTSAKVFFSVFEGVTVAEVARVLSEETKFFRKNLAQHLNLRVTPKLTFIYDRSIQRGNELAELIETALGRDRRFKGDDQDNG